MENVLIFKKEGIVHKPIKFWELSDKQLVAIYQGNRGQRPELDFIVKYKKNGSRLRTPSHTHWIVDLITKKNIDSTLTTNFIKEWYELYDKIEPFQSEQERKDYSLVTVNYFKQKYINLDKTEFSVEFISTLLELFCKCEKQTSGAFMFKNLLKLVCDYCEGNKDFYQIISYSKRV